VTGTPQEIIARSKLSDMKYENHFFEEGDMKIFLSNLNLNPSYCNEKFYWFLE
jgi:hypothetical protein